MSEIIDKIILAFEQNNIKFRIVKSSSTNSIYIYPEKLPNIRISDHAHFEKGKSFAYNIIKNGYNNILLRKGHPIYYYNNNSIDSFIVNFLTLADKKRN